MKTVHQKNFDKKFNAESAWISILIILSILAPFVVGIVYSIHN